MITPNEFEQEETLLASYQIADVDASLGEDVLAVATLAWNGPSAELKARALAAGEDQWAPAPQPVRRFWPLAWAAAALLMAVGVLAVANIANERALAGYRPSELPAKRPAVASSLLAAASSEDWYEHHVERAALVNRILEGEDS
jgi:hypothetical protein